MITFKCMINEGTVTANASLSWPDVLALPHKDCLRGFKRQHFFFSGNHILSYGSSINGKQITLTPRTLNVPNIILSAQIRSF